MEYPLTTNKLNLNDGNWSELFNDFITIALANLGNVLSAKGDIDGAEKAYKQALMYRPNMADTHYNL